MLLGRFDSIGNQWTVYFYIILLLGIDKSWRVSITVLGVVMAASAPQYPSTRHNLFKDLIELFQGMGFLPGCPNINWY